MSQVAKTVPGKPSDGKQPHKSVTQQSVPASNKAAATADSNEPAAREADEARGVSFQVDFLDGATLKVVGDSEELFDVEFLDTRTKRTLYRTKAKANTVSKTAAKFCLDAQIIVRGQSGKLLYKHNFDPEGKRVYVAYESKALGDNISWMPYVEEFRKKYNCHVICSTYFNRLFKAMYPNIEFVAPGTQLGNLYAMYRLGWYINEPSKSPASAHVRPLQGLAADILNVPFREIKPKLDFKPGFRPLSKRYVCIATHASTKLKFWNNPVGWQELVDKLRSHGVEVVAISKEGSELKNVISLGELPLESVMNWIHHSEFVVCLSSGLAWLAWALEKHVVMIANFSQPDHEFVSGITRVTKTSVCSGCWNDPSLPFDRADANWCPRWKDTPRMYECHTSITADDVLGQIGVHLTRLKERSV